MLNRLGVHIKVKDIDKSYKFYKDFGIKPVFTYGRQNWIDNLLKDFPNTPFALEKYEGVTFQLGNSLLEIANGHAAIKPEIFKEDILSPKVSLMIDVDSVNDIVNICNVNKYKISIEPKEYPWGTKEVLIKDPDGLVLVFREFTNKEYADSLSK